MIQRLCVLWSLGFICSCAVLDRNIPVWKDYHQHSPNRAIDLAYTREGTGPPIILIHGFGASGYSWRHLVDPLAEEYEVYALDLKGFGESPKPRDNYYSVYEQAWLVRNFILEHDLRNVTIVGHSYGGGIAMAASLYLAQMPRSRQAGLVMIDSMVYSQKLPGFITVLATPFLGKFITTLVPEKMQVQSLLKKVYYNDKLISKEAVEYYTNGLKKKNAKYASIKTARQLKPRDIDLLVDRYPSLNMPVLILWGMHDEIIPLKFARQLKADLPNARLAIVENSGHAPQEENPEKVLPLLRSYLEKLYR